MITVNNPVKAQRGYPIPNITKLIRSQYPWHTMEIGESFLFNTPQAHVQVYKMNNKLEPKRFISQITADGNRHRCWRVE